MLSPNTILQQRYRIVRELGHGGMGTVYEAIDERVNCVVAIKETLADRDGEAHRAFAREAKLLANLRHQSLPKVMDFFSENNGDFLVMEFIPGYDLAEMLELRGSPFPQSQVLRWAYDLLCVLEYLHDQEPPILHRDIKPSNLKLTKKGEIFLLDFGLAKGAAGQMSTWKGTRSIGGYTRVYASLEQIHGKGSDPRSDIYSLGATLYHLLSAHLPVDAPSRFQALDEDQEDPLKPITDLNPHVSRNIAEVIHKAMAVARKQRLVSATEMRKALRNAAEEDERSSAEEEYRRAEKRRHEREAEKQRAEEENTSSTQGQWRLEDAETAKKTEAARLTGEKHKQLEMERCANEEARLPEEKAGAERMELAIEEERPHVAAATQKADESASSVDPRNSNPAPTVLAEPISGASSGLETIPSQEQIGINSISHNIPSTEAVSMSWRPSRRVVFFAALATLCLTGGMLALWMFSLDGSKPPWPPWALRSFEFQTVTLTNDGGLKNRDRKSAYSFGEDLGGGVELEMVAIPPGEFTMGSNVSRENPSIEESPQHHVRIGYWFFIGKFEITQGQWQAVMGNNPSLFKNCNECPVEQVSWNDAVEFCRKLSARTGREYRLPSESEWEYAARANTTTPFAFGDTVTPEVVNYKGDSPYWNAKIGTNRDKTIRVGSLGVANAFGLYDMHGNVAEWCQDWYQDRYTQITGDAPSDGTAWLVGNPHYRVLRGGSWNQSAYAARSASRNGAPPDAGNVNGINFGFRVVVR